MGVKRPYTDALSTGHYAKKSGLSGKYDNVRRFWEDDATRLFIRPYLKELIDRKSRTLERFRILDLGCGAGDGFDLLMGIMLKDVGIYEYAINLINPEMLGLYMGIDINGDLLTQAREIYGANEKVVFQEADFTTGIPVDDRPFDIYFTSYGTLSHNHDHQTTRLLGEIARHCENSALIICDWLGRYSYEWQELWEGEPLWETFMDYRISYIYPPDERTSAEIQSFPLRIISRQEILGIIREASAQSGISIEVKRIFDRSIMVGRHMDTREYNRHAPPIREVVNSLLEPNVRTSLEPLIIDYIPKKGFDSMNAFLDGFTMCWNKLVEHTIRFLSLFQKDSEKRDGIEELYTFYPDPLKVTVKTMEKVIKATGDLPGDSRANIIEPQLAYALRKLEMDMQPGLGTGHGLVAILEVQK